MSNARHSLELIAEAQLLLGMRLDISLGVVSPAVFEATAAAVDSCEFKRTVYSRSPGEGHTIDTMRGRFRYAGHQVEVSAQLSSRPATAEELAKVSGPEAYSLPRSSSVCASMEGA